MMEINHLAYILLEKILEVNELKKHFFPLEVSPK